MMVTAHHIRTCCALNWGRISTSTCLSRMTHEVDFALLGWCLQILPDETVCTFFILFTFFTLKYSLLWCRCDKRWATVIFFFIFLIQTIICIIIIIICFPFLFTMSLRAQSFLTFLSIAAHFRNNMQKFTPKFLIWALPTIIKIMAKLYKLLSVYSSMLLQSPFQHESFLTLITVKCFMIVMRNS